LVILLTPGQSGDSPMFTPLLTSLSVARIGPGRPRTRPDKVLGDKAYSSRANREFLSSRGIEAVISEPSDQKANRKRRGQACFRNPASTTETYKQRNAVERSFNVFKQWRGLATRYDKLALTYRGGVVLRAITIWLRQ